MSDDTIADPVGSLNLTVGSRVSPRSSPTSTSSSGTSPAAAVDDPDTSPTKSPNPGGGGCSCSSDAANASASGPYGIPNRPIASLDAIILACSGVIVGRPVARLLGNVNFVREAVCVSGAEMELSEIMDGDVSDVMLWFAEWDDLGRRAKEEEGRAGAGELVATELPDRLRWCCCCCCGTLPLPPPPIGIDIDIRFKNVLNPDCRFRWAGVCADVEVGGSRDEPRRGAFVEAEDAIVELE